MKILYAAFVRLPTEKAHGAQIVRTCEALAARGAMVELAIPNRTTDIAQDAFAYYDAKHTFVLTPLPVPDLIPFGRVGFLLSALLFSFRAAKHAKQRQSEVIYSRDKAVLIALRFLTRVPLVWEVHGPESLLSLRLLGTAKIVAITTGLKEELVRQGVAPERICVAPDGVDLAPFAHTESKKDARTRLGLPLDKDVIMYIGRLDGWKGVDTLLRASTLCTQAMQFVVIGGEVEQISYLQKNYPDILFLGSRPYREIAQNQAAADVLVLPNTARDRISLRYTSPLKLFTYMASGTPIVASDLPSIREVVSDSEAFFVEPDNPQALADGILQALAGPDASARAEAARAKVTEYTWDKRAERILACLS